MDPTCQYQIIIFFIFSLSFLSCFSLSFFCNSIRGRTRGTTTTCRRRNWKSQKNSSARQGGSSSFTPMEQQIYAKVDSITKNTKRIIRESRDGIKLSPEDETFIVTNILMYHPEKEKKIAGEGNYTMVDKHQKFHSSRCLYVASSDGSYSDFSYKKCLENFVRIHDPGAADC